MSSVPGSPRSRSPPASPPRPILEGLARLKEASAHERALPAPDRRVDQLQAEVASLRERLDRLSAVEDFYVGLRASGEAPRLPREQLPPT